MSATTGNLLHAVTAARVKRDEAKTRLDDARRDLHHFLAAFAVADQAKLPAHVQAALDAADAALARYSAGQDAVVKAHKALSDALEVDEANQ